MQPVSACDQVTLHCHKPLVGLSSCLGGEKVRFDGGHKKHGYILNTLSYYFTFRHFCPEVSIGLGVPREPIHLIATDQHDEYRCIGVKHPERDVTDALKASAKAQHHWLDSLSGYIVKKGSPSCGMERVKVFQHAGKNAMPTNNGTGLFTQQVMRDFPLLPVEEEGRLGDPVLRENFIERLYIYSRWQALVKKGLTANGLIAFHSQHKFNILSHNQIVYRNLGKLISGVTDKTATNLGEKYIRTLMPTLKKPATRGNHVNVLQHIQGYLKDHINHDEKQELTELLLAYQQGFIPRIVPITLFNHFFRKYPNDYIRQAYYMQPYPGEMKLINFA